MQDMLRWGIMLTEGLKFIVALFVLGAAIIIGFVGLCILISFFFDFIGYFDDRRNS